MKISLNWINDYVDLKGVNPDELIKKIGLKTAEIEGVEYKGKDLKGVIVARIEKVLPHPSSEKLHILKVDTGSELVQVVCGAPNVKEGMKTAFAPVGSSVLGQQINVASIAGFMPGPLMDTYYATKNYVVRLSQGIKEELRRKKSNVGISVLCPGPVRTNFDNVAGVSFSLRGMDSDYVARYAINKMLRGKFIIVPGFTIKMLRVVSKIVPDSALVRFVYKSQRRKG